LDAWHELIEAGGSGVKKEGEDQKPDQGVEAGGKRGKHKNPFLSFHRLEGQNAV